MRTSLPTGLVRRQPGGVLMMMLVDSREFVIDESN